MGDFLLGISLGFYYLWFLGQAFLGLRYANYDKPTKTV